MVYKVGKTSLNVKAIKQMKKAEFVKSHKHIIKDAAKVYDDIKAIKTK